MLPVIVTIIVGTVLATWLGMFVWSGIRAGRASRFRADLRDEASVPEGFHLGIREPDALRAPFVLPLRGQVLDIAQSMTGSFRTGTVGITDVVVRHRPGADPQQLTVATVDVDWLWPWLRLRRDGVDAPDQDNPPIDTPDLDGWILETANPDWARDAVTPALAAWLRRGDWPLQIELTPRHLLLAVDGHVPDDRLPELVELATGVVDHIPAEARQSVAPPDPAEVDR